MYFLKNFKIIIGQDWGPYTVMKKLYELYQGNPTKSNYYDTWKYIRTKMETALKNHDFNSKSKNELEKSFMKYLQIKYENTDYDKEKINIIDERNEFKKRIIIKNNSFNY